MRRRAHALLAAGDRSCLRAGIAHQFGCGLPDFLPERARIAAPSDDAMQELQLRGASGVARLLGLVGLHEQDRAVIRDAIDSAAMPGAGTISGAWAARVTQSASTPVQPSCPA